ncbi:MAG: anti-sigma factor [Candidatus Eremiobacteraeota bacterium]|nr:anti-sigma factor [Candidatus Eremiobacteraeota bacterium]
MNAAEHADLLDLVAVYALGALNGEETRAVSAHVATCEECRREYNALRPVGSAVGFATDDVALPAPQCAPLKRRVMSAAFALSPLPRAARAQPPVRMFVVSTIAALAAALIFAFFAVDAQRQLMQTRTQARADAQLVAELRAAGAQRYAVPGGEILKASDRVYLVMNALAAPPKGRVYQAWVLPPGAKAVSPSITFVPDAQGFVIVSLPESAATVAAVAISVEPPGGSRAPTTKPSFVRPLT